eukprot:TRINITY_DN12282_c0_g3_i9.p1 TRINITY_DN12282_c0_g3~~TRINITY_DN12282_c0_g3_i9.p1  ORF type:complete len:105 (-),score=3.58 TRINITY_DN12282_c0_g3_i9:145-459(-)
MLSQAISGNEHLDACFLQRALTFKSFSPFESSSITSSWSSSATMLSVCCNRRAISSGVSLWYSSFANIRVASRCDPRCFVVLLRGQMQEALPSSGFKQQKVGIF